MNFIRVVGGDCAWLALSLLLAECTTRIGIRVLHLAPLRRATFLVRAGLGFLIGTYAVGYAFLGIALAGLYMRSVMVFLVALLALPLGRRECRTFIVVSALKEFATMGPLGLGVISLGVIPWLPRLLLPELNHDGYLYHLAIPWQFLQVHRAILSEVPWDFHLSLPVEMSYGLSLSLGDDRVARTTVVGSLVALSLVWTGSRRRRGLVGADWLGTVFLLAAGFVVVLLGTTKNDVVTSAVFASAARLWLDRRWDWAALFFGWSMASKPTCGPIVLVWCLAMLPPLRTWPSIGGLALAPLLPWLAKSYLATGNPLFPFAGRFFHSYGWGAPNQASFQLFLNRAGANGTVTSLWVAVERWASATVHWNPLLFVFIPVLAASPRYRRVALACLASQLLMIGLRNEPRYVMPTVFVLSLVFADGLSRWPSRWQAAVSVACVLLALGRICIASDMPAAGWADLAVSPEAVRTRCLPNYEAMGKEIADRHAKRILTVGERLAYRLPARVLFGDGIGETPLIWTAAYESRTPARMSIKFRQLGASLLLHNYIGAAWRSYLNTPFPWSAGMLRRYLAFVRDHARIVVQSPTNDYDPGGYGLYELSSRGPSARGAPVWFLPGTEVIYEGSRDLSRCGRLGDSVRSCRRACQLVPEVGHGWNVLGHAYLESGSASEASRVLDPWVKQGMIDESNLSDYGTALSLTGDLDGGERFLRKALRVQRGMGPAIALALVETDLRRSEQEMVEGSYGMAMNATRQAELDLVPLDGGPAPARRRKLALAKILSMRANICRAIGERTRAEAFQHEAEELSRSTATDPEK